MTVKGVVEKYGFEDIGRIEVAEDVRLCEYSNEPFGFIQAVGVGVGAFDQTITIIRNFVQNLSAQIPYIDEIIVDIDVRD
jgi:hypothetical protein